MYEIITINVIGYRQLFIKPNYYFKSFKQLVY